MPDQHCGLCGTKRFPLAYGPTERATVCPACAVGAVLTFRDHGDATLIADLFESANLALVARTAMDEALGNEPETAS